jgi:hypothetical protein
MKLFSHKIYGLFVYVDALALIEPAHIHANMPPVVAGAAKIWLHRDGNLSVADYGKFDKRTIHKVVSVLSANFNVLCDRYAETLGILVTDIEFKRKDDYQM